MVDCYVGEIRLWTRTKIPVNWHACDGTLLSIREYQELYATIGTTYGGDGVNTFGIPDLRGKIPVGVGQYPSGAAYILGQGGGVTQVTVTQAQMPAHTHTMLASTQAATTLDPNGTALADPSNTFNTYIPYASTAKTLELSPNAISPAGGSQAHNNIMPSFPLQYMIALLGIFPVPQS